MTSFIKKVFTSTQPKTAATTSKPAAPNVHEITATSTQEDADCLTHFDAFDMESEEDWLDIKFFTTSPTKIMATTQNGDKSTRAVPWIHQEVPSNSMSQVMDAATPKAPRAIPPECGSAFCPVLKIHGAKPHKRDDWDLPEMIQQFQAHVDNLTAQKKYIPTHIVTLLDLFYSVHGTIGNFDVPSESVKASYGGSVDGNCGLPQFITVRKLPSRLPKRMKRTSGTKKVDAKTCKFSAATKKAVDKVVNNWPVVGKDHASKN